MIQQEILFPCTPEKFFSIYLNSECHSSFTQSTVNINHEIGAEFDAYDGYCHGVNLKIIKYKIIEQSWQSAEEDWQADQYSTITFEMEEHPEGMKLLFSQKGAPETLTDALAQGWYDYYWEPIKEYLSK